MHAIRADVDQRVVPGRRIRCRVETDPLPGRFAHQAVAYASANVFIVTRIRLQVEILGTGVESQQDAAGAAAFDPRTLHQAVGRAALEIDSGGKDIVDRATLHRYAVAIHAIDALRVLRRNVRRPDAGVEDFAALDKHVVAVGRDLDAVAARVANHAIPQGDLTGPRTVPWIAPVPFGLQHDPVIIAAGNLQPGQHRPVRIRINPHTRREIRFVCHRCRDHRPLPRCGAQSDPRTAKTHLLRFPVCAAANLHHIPGNRLLQGVVQGTEGRPIRSCSGRVMAIGCHENRRRLWLRNRGRQ